MEIASMLHEATKSAKPVYFGHMGVNSPLFFGTMVIFMVIIWLLIIITLVLFIVWLWKQIQKGK